MSIERDLERIAPLIEHLRHGLQGLCQFRKKWARQESGTVADHHIHPCEDGGRGLSFLWERRQLARRGGLLHPREYQPSHDCTAPLAKLLREAAAHAIIGS